MKNAAAARKKAIKSAIADSAGAARKAHFAANGSADMWRGRSSCLDGAKSKARQDKRACRSKRWGD